MGYTKQDVRVKYNEKNMIRRLCQAFPQIDFQFSDHIFIDLGEAVNSRYIHGQDSTDQGFLISQYLQLGDWFSFSTLDSFSIYKRES